MSEAVKKLQIDSRPNIFTYHDYVQFLREYLMWMQSQNSSLSLRLISEKSGFSHAYLSHITSEKRALNPKQVSRVARALELDRAEGQFLVHLVVLAESSSAVQRQKAFQKMRKFSQFQSRQAQDIEAYKVIGSWFVPVLREMVQLADFEMDAKWIQKRMSPSVPLAKIKSALSFLIEHRYLERVDGKWVMTTKHLQCSSGIYQLALRKFHVEMKHQAISSFDLVDKASREQIGYTLALPEEAFVELSRILVDAKERIKSLEDRYTKVDAVYHVDLAAFPVTKLRRVGV